MEHKELSAWLRLQLTSGIGNVTARKLLTNFGLPQSIFTQSEASLRQVVTTAQARALCSLPDDLAILLDTTWQWLEADIAARRVLTLGDPAYPQSLLNIEDPPLMLYAMGATQAWGSSGLSNSSNTCLAVVGSRNPTPQGVANAHDFSCSLAKSGLTIVSGLALGVDAAAHRGALTGSGSDQLATIAIVGTGLDRVYPKQNRELAHAIAQRGVILSEFPLGTPPLAANFPMRNRIISGLCRGTLVVEAALQSGSLITARLAAEQGRDVFAIPGSIHATQARGCHALIRQGAKLVESANDILEELHWESPSSEITQADTPQPDCPVLAELGFEPCSLDALQTRTGLPTHSLQAQLMALELMGQVARLPGGLFQRMVRC
jgi:DNA processing protein